MAFHVSAEFRAGLAEAIKNAIIGAPHLFAALAKGQYDLTWLVFEAVSVKVRVVQADPFEQGRRAVLNLGHTFGHAFERLSNFQMRHGEAVARGVVCAARLAVRLGHCSGDTAEAIMAVLERAGLPVERPPSPFADRVDQSPVHSQHKQLMPHRIGDVYASCRPIERHSGWPL